LLDAEAGERIRLAADAHVTLVAPFVRRADGSARNPVRLWVADLALPSNVLEYTAQHAFPIRYSYVQRRWPLSYYQTVFASEPGSAEMPSAGRPFTSSAVRRLQRKGVRVVPLVLHAGVASLETDEPPYPERYWVSRATADAINEARAAGGRVVAVGTTVVRALETVASDAGHLRPGQGWTDLVITPERGLHIVDALLTGLHAPRATHLAMLTAFAGHDHLARAYDAALRQKYLWHEFGDLHLILPGGSASSNAVTGKWSDG
jgi:S-adenosylmethionine:tRNA ribosyltransferase-isomerase